jgi:transcription termination/antitermination protein NusA
VDDDGRQATVIVPDDQLSLAIGREGQNARLAARLTGWRVDIKSETEFSAEEAEHGYDEEDVSGRCSAILSTGRRCPNASLPGSRYCGLDSHQALRRFDTDKVEVLSGLEAADIAALADADSSDDEVAKIVARAAPAVPEPAGDAPADTVPPEEPETQAPEAETPHAEEPEAETPEPETPEPETPQVEAPPAEEALAEDAAPEPAGRPAAEEPTAGTAGEGAAP